MRRILLAALLMLMAAPVAVRAEPSGIKKGAGEYQAGVTARIIAKTAVTGNGQQIVYPRTDRAEVTAMEVTLPPGAETGWHQHPIPVYAYVQSGELEVEIAGGLTKHFKSGDAIIEVVNTLHNGRNRGEETVRLAVFYLGVQGEPNVIKMP
jgi:quercetin dioxygenase-like cupin family protein